MASQVVGLNSRVLMTIIAAGAVLPTADKLFPSRRPDVADSGFAVPAASSAAGRETAPPASGATTVFAAASMLALQEQAGLDGNAEGALADREARKHAQDLLEALSTLQKALLAGGTPEQILSRLTALAPVTCSLDDPVLARIVGSIRLRAQLEIIRLTRRPG